MRKPKYFFSIGKVNTPTIIRVEVNKDITVYFTPHFIKMADKGKTIKAGAKINEPNKAAIIKLSKIEFLLR